MCEALPGVAKRGETRTGMGAIHFSIDKNLVDFFRRMLPLETFVETGTFEGDSVERVCSDFREIYSVEIAESYHRKAMEKFAGLANVQLLRGDSPEVLRRLRPKLAGGSVLYWLDAHWCDADHVKGGQHSQCPLLDELDSIGSLNERSVILIDDARLFLAPPPSPHEASDWPDFDSLVRKLLATSPLHQVMVLNDVIVFFPAVCREAIYDFARTASFDLLIEINMSRKFRDLEERYGHVHRDKILIEQESSALRQALSERQQETVALQRVLSERQQETAALQNRISQLQHALSQIENTFWYRSVKAWRTRFLRVRR